MNLLKHKELGIQFLKYIVVGGLAFIVDFLTLYILTEYQHFHYMLSAGIAFIIGLNVNYILAKFFVFKDTKIVNPKKEYLAIVIISISGLILNQLLLFVITEFLGVYYLYSKLIAATLILIYNFAIRKIFVFN